MNWLLLIVLLILVANVIYGIHKGALRMLYRALSWLFVVAFMVAVTPHMDAFLTDRTGLDEWIEERTESYAGDRWNDMKQQMLEQMTKGNPDGSSSSSTDSENQNSFDQGVSILNHISSTITDSSQEENENDASAVDDITNEVSRLLGDGKIQVPESLQDAFDQARDSIQKSASDTGDRIKKAEEQAEQTVIDKVSETITGYVMRGIAAILTFLLAKVIVWIVGIFIHAADRNRFIGGISRVLGAVLGLGIGFLYVWILLYIIDCFCWTKWGMSLTAMINDSAFLQFTDTHNLIRILIAG